MSREKHEGESKGDIIDLRGQFAQLTELSVLNRQQAAEWEWYSAEFTALCNLAQARQLAFQVRQTRRGVEAIRFGRDNVWHASIPQDGADKPKPAS